MVTDDFLPRTCELATQSSDRQTKVAACELLHGLVLLLLGNTSSLTEEISRKHSPEKLFEKLFPVLLELSVDVELVGTDEVIVIAMLLYWLRLCRLSLGCHNGYQNFYLSILNRVTNLC